jgi:hypothetical protein
MGKSRKGQTSEEVLKPAKDKLEAAKQSWRDYPIYRGGLGLVGTSWERRYRGCRLTLDFFVTVPEVPMSDPLRDLWCRVYPELANWNSSVRQTPVVWRVCSRYGSAGGTCPHRTPREAKAALQRYVDRMILWGTMRGNPQ